MLFGQWWYAVRVVVVCCSEVLPGCSLVQIRVTVVGAVCVSMENEKMMLYISVGSLKEEWAMSPCLCACVFSKSQVTRFKVYPGTT